MSDAPRTVLVVEDELGLQNIMSLVLAKAGLNVIVAGDGVWALKQFDAHDVDLVILDLGLPRMDGWGVLTRLRERSATVPIIVLTARGDVPDRVRGLNYGADDYLVKPVSNAELVARAASALRRASSTDEVASVFVDGPVQVDRAARTVSVDGAELEVSGTEWRLLLALTAHPGAVVSATTLLEKAWNDPSGIGADKVKFAVMRLRRAFEAAGVANPIATLRGRGYRWVGPGGASDDDAGVDDSAGVDDTVELAVVAP